VTPEVEPLEARLIAILLESPRLVRVLEAAQSLDLQDWRLTAGAIYQTVWNRLTGREPDYGLKDFDLAYFDPDVSYEAEDRVIRHAAQVFPSALSPLVEVRNQARVHLWFEERFGEPYTPLGCTDEALRRYVCPAFSVGVRLEKAGRVSVAAPFGLEDCFAMRLRPNPERPVNPLGFEKVVASCVGRWPELRVSA
jgi:hypothetical protein